jgi:hypothetical protein
MDRASGVGGCGVAAAEVSRLGAAEVLVAAGGWAPGQRGSRRPSRAT